MTLSKTAMRVALPVVLVGCKKTPEAPVELEELSAFIYDHAEDEDPAALVDGVNNLADWLAAGGLEQLGEGYSVETLDQQTLDDLGDGDRDASKIAGAAIASTTDLEVEPVVETLILADQMKVYGETYATYDREFLHDADCFVAKDCDWLEMQNTSLATLPLSIEIETSMHAQERWVEAEVGSVMVHRSYLTEPSEGGVLDLQAQYHMAVNLPWDDGMVRFQAMWADADVVGLEVPEGTLINMLVNNLTKADETLYAYTKGDKSAE